jgi:hypothetical protein
MGEGGVKNPEKMPTSLWMVPKEKSFSKQKKKFSRSKIKSTEVNFFGPKNHLIRELTYGCI